MVGGQATAFGIFLEAYHHRHQPIVAFNRNYEVGDDFVESSESCAVWDTHAACSAHARALERCSLNTEYISPDARAGH